MTLEQFIYSILTSGIVSGAIVLWFKYKLQYSIKFEYDKNIEKLKNEIEAKKKAELIAKLLSEWLSFPEEQKELNRLTFEAFLWLPDDIAKDLSDLLAHKENAPDVKDILLKIRKYLLYSDTILESGDIIMFKQEHMKKLFERAIKMSNKSLEEEQMKTADNSSL